MKWLIRLFIMLLIGTLFSLSAYSYDDTPKTIAERYTTVQSISSYLYTYYKYESDSKQFDSEDYWQTPEELIRNQKGDCEDFAILVQAILKELDIESQLIGVYWEEKDNTKTYKGHAHMIVVFQDENDKYSFISNQYYFAAKKDTIEKAIEHSVKNWQEYVIFNSDETIIKEVKNKNWVEEESLENGE